jgi:hypothetical protein
MPPPDVPAGMRRLRKVDRKTATSERALQALDEWIEVVGA